MEQKGADEFENNQKCPHCKSLVETDFLCLLPGHVMIVEEEEGTAIEETRRVIKCGNMVYKMWMMFVLHKGHFLPLIRNQDDDKSV